MFKKSTLTRALLAANLLLLPVALAYGHLPRSGEGDPIRLAYEAELRDATGQPVDGNYTIDVRVFSDDSDDAELLYAESFAGHVVEDGVLTLLLGAGDPVEEGTFLEAEDLWENPEAVVEILVDGEQVGPRVGLGKVPHAVVAHRVPAGGIRWGDGHGYVPAEAMEPHVEVVQGIYQAGDSVEGLPDGDGWTCAHTVTPVGPGFERDRLNAQDLFVGHVGPGTLSPALGLTVEFGDPGGIQQPGLDPSTEVFYVHAFSDCEAGAWAPMCSWFQEPAAEGLRVSVLSVCTRFAG
jgi:hypothetical protein